MRKHFDTTSSLNVNGQWHSGQFPSLFDNEARSSPEITSYLTSEVLDPLHSAPHATRDQHEPRPPAPQCEFATRRIELFQQEREQAIIQLKSEFSCPPLSVATTIHLFVDTNSLDCKKYHYAAHTLRLHEERARLEHPSDKRTTLHFVRVGADALFPSMHCTWARVAVLEIIAALTNANLILFDLDAAPTCLWTTSQLCNAAIRDFIAARPHRASSPPTNVGALVCTETVFRANAGFVVFPAPTREQEAVDIASTRSHTDIMRIILETRLTLRRQKQQRRSGISNSDTSFLFPFLSCSSLSPLQDLCTYENRSRTFHLISLNFT